MPLNPDNTEPPIEDITPYAAEPDPLKYYAVQLEVVGSYTVYVQATSPEEAKEKAADFEYNFVSDPANVDELEFPQQHISLNDVDELEDNVDVSIARHWIMEHRRR